MQNHSKLLLRINEISAVTGIPESTLWKIVGNTEKYQTLGTESDAPKHVDLNVYDMHQELKVLTLLPFSVKLFGISVT